MGTLSMNRPTYMINTQIYWLFFRLVLTVSTDRQWGVRRAEQAETHPGSRAVLLTPMLGQPIWSNGWWWITAPSCVHVTQTPQGSEQVHMAFDPSLSWFKGEARQTRHSGAKHSQSPSATLPLQGPLCCAVWGCHVTPTSHGTARHHIRDPIKRCT